MAPSRHGLLVLLGLITSIQAVPAPVPEPDVPAARQIGLIPPIYSVSWDSPPPVTTEDPEPEDPEDPEEPTVPTYPVPSNQISLSPPSFSVSWDPPLPTKTRKPWPPRPTKKTSKPGVSATVSWGKREDDEEAEPTDAPERRDEISLSPPTYSISWDPPLVTKTKKPWPPRPTKKSTKKPGVSATISWGKRQEDEDPEPTDFPEPEPTDDPQPEPENPDDPIDIPPNFPTPGNSIGIQPPHVSMSWGKRDDAAYKTTYPAPTFGLGEPTATIWWPKPPKHTSGYISWGKRQDDEEPTPVLPPVLPTPPDQISMNPPTASMSWGKRDDAEYPPQSYPPPTWWLGEPTATIWWPKPPKHTSGYISWGKRQDDEEPTTVLPSDLPTPPDQISINPPTASMSWGKRDVDPPPTWGIVWPTLFPKPTWDFPKPSGPGYVSWGKRDAAPEPTAPADLPTAEVPKHPCSLTTTVTRPVPCPLIACSAPCRQNPGDSDDDDDDSKVQGEPSACPATVIVPGKCPTCDCPSTLITRKPTPTKPHHPTSPCPTVTKTIVPPCIPPVCPHGLTACKTADATIQEKRKEEVQVREIEKSIVTIKTFTVPSATVTPIIDCTPVPTVTEYMGCPTYTCVPFCSPTSTSSA